MSREIKKLKLINYLTWLILFVWVLTWGAWFWPRHTVHADSYITNSTVYRVADKITVEFYMQSDFDGKSIYDVQLVCDGGRYLLKSFEVVTKKTPRVKQVINVGLIPAIPTPDQCVVKTNAIHIVPVLPFINRHYINSWETNRFLVEAKE